MNDITLENFLNQIDSASPTPGGGCVAAVVAQLGICLGRMYGHLSVKRKAFSAQDEADQEVFCRNFAELSSLCAAFEELAQADMDAYQSVIEAYRTKDHQAIQRAVQKAIDVPYAAMKYAADAMQLLAEMMPYGNQRAVSDCAIAIILCEGCVQSSYLNVLINIQTLENQIEAEKALKAIDELQVTAAELKQKALTECIHLIKQ